MKIRTNFIFFRKTIDFAYATMIAHINLKGILKPLGVVPMI
jgi:hypothetical protein